MEVLNAEQPIKKIKKIVPKEEEEGDLSIEKKPISKTKVLKVTLLILCLGTFSIGIWFTLAMYVPLGGINNSITFFIAPLAGYLAFIYLVATLILMKLIPKIRKFKIIKSKERDGDLRISNQPIKTTLVVIGLCLVFLNFMPILTTPIAINTAENEFEQAYGPNWRDDIPKGTNSFFLQTQFNLFQYYLGIPHSECNYDLDIVYHEDGSLKLRFDVYYPKESNVELPGKNSIIIKIHGGGWTSGDKSIGNVMPVNKYLASQGYVVFDIQYGLFDTGEFNIIPTPEDNLGDFNLTDMVTHIGIFTKKLASTYAVQYNANLNSTFIMGGSAGGHLTGVFGLGYNDPYYAGIFSDALVIKGIIPIYPANDMERISRSHSGLIDGNNTLTYDKFTPSKLADSEDPPALIFQGLQDGLVVPKNSYDIEQALEDSGVNCMVLTFPLAAHANDLIVNNNFAQVWLYYVERFLYLEQ